MVLERLRQLRELLSSGCQRNPLLQPGTQRARVSRRAPKRRPWLEALEERNAPAVLTVTSLAGNMTQGDGQTTLREAFNAAITASTVDGVTGTGNDTIRFAAGLAGGTIALTQNDTFNPYAFGPTALVVAAGRSITIDGSDLAGSGITISGNNARRVFGVLGTGTLTLQGITVTGGRVQAGAGGSVLTLSGNAGGGAGGMGGAVFNAGTLNVIGCTFTGNAAIGGDGGGSGGSGTDSVRNYGGGGGVGGAGGNARFLGGSGGTGAGGGGVAGPGANNTISLGGNGGLNELGQQVGQHASGTLGGGGGGGNNLTGGGSGGSGTDLSSGGFGGGGGGAGGGDGLFVGGHGGFGGGGGGGGASGGIGTTGNGGFGGGAGGGLDSDGGGIPGFGGGAGGLGTLTKNGGGAGAGLGGAIFNNGGTVSLTNSTFTGNTAEGGLGGTGTAANGADGQGLGGAIFNRNGNLTILNCTISSNTAAQGGRGVYNLGDGATATATVNNTIIGQGDTSVTDFVGNTINGGTNTTSGVGNLIRTSSDFAGTVASTANPLLGSLANNGGPTATMAPQAGSPVTNAGDDTAAAGLTTDQRGTIYARVVIPHVDIGAFEQNDNVAPTVTINQALGQSDPANVVPFQFTVVFSEAVSGFDASDISFAGSTAPGSLAALVSGSGTTYTVVVFGMTGSGNVVASVVAGAASDAAGNASLASTSTDNTVAFDNVGPSVTINQFFPDPTNAQSITFGAVFSEAVTGFDGSDISFAGSTASGSLAVISITGSGTTYEVRVSGMTGSGTVIASVVAGAVSDALGNPSLASTSTDNTITWDNVPPTVTINQAAGQSDPTNSLPIFFDVVFSEAVTDFDASDLVRSGTATGGTLDVSGSGASYTVTLSGAVTPGTITLTIPADAAFDAADNGNLASTSTDNTVTYENVAPTVTIDQAAGQADPINAGPIQFTVVFSDAVSGFTGADIAFTGSTAPGSLLATVSGSGTTYTVVVFGMTGSGSVVASVVVGAAVDAAGNPSLASTSTDNSVSFDNAAPSADLVDVIPDPSATAVSSISIVFSETVSGFNLADLSLTRDGGANLLTGNQTLTDGGDGTWTLGNLANLTASSGSYQLSLTAAGSGIADLAGNALAADASDSWVTDATAPTADVVDVTPDPRKDAVNNITIVFNEVVNCFELADLSLTRNGGANLLTSNQTLTDNGNGTWTLGNLASLTATAGSYQLTLTAAGSDIADTAGNALDGNASDGWIVNLNQYAVGQGQGTGGTGLVQVLYAVDNSEHFHVTPYAVPGEVRVAMADVNGDGTTDLITAPGKGQLGVVKVYDGRNGTQFSNNFGSFVPFAGWTKGLFVAAGDTNHDNSNAGRAEIFVGQDKGGGQVQVFNGATDTWTALLSKKKTIKPFGSTYKSGVTVAAGDTDKDGQVELIMGRLAGVTQVRIYDIVTRTLAPAFIAFSGINRGVYVSAGDTDGDGRDEIFASLASGDLGLVKVINLDPPGHEKATLALDSTFKGGLRVGATDRDGDGRAEVLVGAGPSAGGARFEVLDGTTLDELFADDNLAITAGIYVS